MREPAGRAVPAISATLRLKARSGDSYRTTSLIALGIRFGSCFNSCYRSRCVANRCMALAIELSVVSSEGARVVNQQRGAFGVRQLAFVGGTQ